MYLLEDEGEGCVEPTHALHGGLEGEEALLLHRRHHLGPEPTRALHFTMGRGEGGLRQSPSLRVPSLGAGKGQRICYGQWAVAPTGASCETMSRPVFCTEAAMVVASHG